MITELVLFYHLPDMTLENDPLLSLMTLICKCNLKNVTENIGIYGDEIILFIYLMCLGRGEIEEVFCSAW